MTPEVAIIERLKATTPVQAIVGDRIYQLKLPQRVSLPAIRVQRVSRIETGHLRGGSLNCWGRMQIDAIANEFDTRNPDPLGTVNDLCLAIRRALAWKAFVAGGSPDTLEICLIQPIMEGPDMVIADELHQVKTPMDFEVYWREAA